MMLGAHKRYALVLAGAFFLWWAVLAVSPRFRQDWLLENVIVGVFLIALALTSKYFTFSRLSMTLIFIFLCLHEVGAHYTYSEVPYDIWFEKATGRSMNEMLGWQRNNFDRVIHFSYGLLLAYPIREIFLRVAAVKGFWGYFLPLDVTMSTSMMFELFEWLAAENFGNELGTAYLGMQGDIWDAQKDMALASAGALIAMLMTAGINIYMKRDFAKEWNDSLRVKDQEPLGESAIARMLNDRGRSD